MALSVYGAEVEAVVVVVVEPTIWKHSLLVTVDDEPVKSELAGV